MAHRGRRWVPRSVDCRRLTSRVVIRGPGIGVAFRPQCHWCRWPGVPGVPVAPATPTEGVAGAIHLRL